MIAAIDLITMPCLLVVPSVLDCGGCLVGDAKVWSTQCFNLGGEGKFKLMLDEGDEEDGSNAMVCMQPG